jgi:RNA polymerase sigma-70 factor, ECF subfamily
VPRPSDPGDRRLARRLRRKDADALREAYDRYGRTTFGFLVHVLGDRGAAEDIQQQVFLEVWQRADRYDAKRGSLLTWIMTIARSRAIDQLRRRVPEPRDPAGTVAVLEAASGADAAHVDIVVEQWYVAHLLAALPPEEAGLLRLRFYGGRSQTEIAAETGLPLSTVKSRMARGMNRLRLLTEELER